MQVLEGPLLHDGHYRYRIITQEDGDNMRTGWIAMNWTMPLPAVSRIFGEDRYRTAVEISQEGWSQAATVVLARGDHYADALAGVSLAYQLDAPILLTRPTDLDPAAHAEIQRLKSDKVIILGGTAAVSQGIEDTLRGQGLTVERISGAQRYATAVLAYALNFPDALAVAPYAAKQGIPILLTSKDALHADTQAALAALAVQRTLVVGGSEVISDALWPQLPAPERINGSNRYETAMAISEYFGPSAEHFYISTGLNFADAITEGVLAAKNDTGILLVGNTVPPGVSGYITSQGIRRLTIFGGTAAVPEKTREDLAAILP